MSLTNETDPSVDVTCYSHQCQASLDGLIMLPDIARLPRTLATSYWQTETGRSLVCGPHVCGHGPGPSNVLSVNNVPSTHHRHAHYEQIISVQFLVQRNAGPFPESYFILDWIAKLVNIRFY